MIKTEEVTIRKRKFFYTYSDEGYFIKNTDGDKFASAYDLDKVEYAETDEKIEKDEKKSGDKT